MEAFWIRLAWLLPKRLAYWCAVRVAAHATQGPWSHEHSPGVTISDVLKRWKNGNG